MRLYFSAPRDGASEGTLAEAEIHFDAGTPLAGMKLVGITIRKSKNEERGGYFVTVPSRAFGSGADRKYFDYLRSADPAHAREKNAGFRRWVSREYEEWARSKRPVT